MSTDSALVTTTTGPRPGSGPVVAPPWLVLSIVLAGPLLSAMDGFIVFLAVPSLQTEFGATDASIQVVIAGYALVYGTGMIVGARVGDRFGRRKTFALATALFTVTSVACGLAADVGYLIAARLVQGASAAMMVPQALAIISTMYHDDARARAIKWYGFTLGLGAVLGQVVSGALIEADLFGLGWRACFLINLPIGAVAAVLTLRFVPDSRAPGRPGLDLVGMVLVILALLAVVLPLTVGRQEGWPPWTWLCLAGAVPLFGLFGVHEHRLRAGGGAPLVPLHLFRERAFSVGLACQLVFWTGQASYYLVLGLYGQLGYGLGALGAGLLFVAVNLGFMAASLTARRVQRRVARQAIALGALLRIIGLVAQIVVVAGIDGSGVIAWLIPFLVLDGFGMGLAVAPLVSTILARVPAEHAGSASGVLTTAVQVGCALGVALIGLIFYNVLEDSTGPDAYQAAFNLSLLYPIGVSLVLVLLVQLLPGKSVEPEGQS